MQTLITGLISVVTASLFLGWMAYRVNELPFALVVLIGIAGMLADFIHSLRRPENGG